MRIFSLLALLCGLILLNADHSFAQVGPKQQPAAGGALSRVTPEQVATALTQVGIRAQVATQNNEKIVRMTIGDLKSPVVFFSDCNNQTIQLFEMLGLTRHVVLAKDEREALLNLSQFETTPVVH